ncbi:serine hydrolase domain-containing protein [Sphingosinicella rhizophila]|uniref:Serine hydrolase domain-containing protein n=1 Tax=Sphingosinicella rhizophila TaxID=3050082 RepID=A0ABU3QAG4_9SPHN|nr:serine hydrolase domain-containing protein [Sphingosinicella sp. GR2756]MDT9599935.1 serine hydrolase domain-containing protein [Sphingosinicella sp. GR2756]
MIRNVKLALAAVAAVVMIQAPAIAADNQAVAAAIDQAVQKAIAEGVSPGLQVAVYKDGSPLLVKGYGSADLEMSVPVTNDSVFRIGSVTKQFTAVALLQLQEAGKLSIDDTLSKYYPNYPRGGDITIRQMLNHTSGLYNYTSQEDYMKADAMVHRSTEEYVDYFSKMKKTQDFEPGTSWMYSNTAYYILGAIVEKVEGKPLGAVFQERFFGPLGMTRTAIDDENDIVAGRVEGYAADGPGKFKNATFISMTAPGGGGAMRSTASDLARWNAALFGGKLLKPASFAAMTAPGKLKDGQNSGIAIAKLAGMGMPAVEYGFGLMTQTVDGHAKVAHGGGINGFNAQLAEYPKDRLTVAVLSNTIGKDVGAGKVADEIERIALGLPPKP